MFFQHYYHIVYQFENPRYFCKYGHKREDYGESIEEYVEKISGGLGRAEENIQVKREVVPG